MKKLYITIEQATQLGKDLIEYATMSDSSGRSLFKGFKITFGDMFAQQMQSDQSFEVAPIPEFTEINEDSNTD